MQALGVWMFISKFIKLVGHYIRYPVDVILLPVSILFGYFHGAIKIYAVLTLNVVSCRTPAMYSFIGCFVSAVGACASAASYLRVALVAWEWALTLGLLASLSTPNSSLL
ncbi:uncharacterized protein BO80DRAFT_234994 [Aspergillus ibericus CBS 121593]|uniref:Uncharacterized protein n=1 Tax=Aspergillus ibericus CBS 121593 TaxID=1448316 RepID=A0A395HB68_9EURO|nr:hypothetical protein BO80DRAFT_234994 [Aspergillus ibericus CBS 121593]RAL04375.1 hypothetical protein BO80DRAFT_234994 [Aspergillus ibericus CBS 121593]